MASLAFTISSAYKSVSESSNLGIVRAINGATLDLDQSRRTFDSPLVTEALGCSTNRGNFKFCMTDNCKVNSPHDERIGSGSASSESMFALHRDCREILDFVIIGVIKPSGS